MDDISRWQSQVLRKRSTRLTQSQPPLQGGHHHCIDQLHIFLHRNSHSLCQDGWWGWEEGPWSEWSLCLLDPSVIPAGVGGNVVDKGSGQQENKMKVTTVWAICPFTGNALLWWWAGGSLWDEQSAVCGSGRCILGTGLLGAGVAISLLWERLMRVTHWIH